MEQATQEEQAFVISYLALRKAIGIIGITLPFVLAFGNMIGNGHSLESSISSYYYTVMRDIFVGAMCSIGVFLFSYRGYERQDDIAGDLGAFFAIGLALIPTSPDLAQDAHTKVAGAVHLLLASGFFLVLAYFSLVLFTKSAPNITPTSQKKIRNKIYRTCGALILIAMLLIVLVMQLPDDAVLNRHVPVFWLESIAVIAFGVSWLTKGEAFLKDAPLHGVAPSGDEH